MERTWSQYQQAIFSFIANGTGNAIVTAVAGSGKSTTIVEGMKLVPSGATSIFLAFNKAIADELIERQADEIRNLKQGAQPARRSAMRFL